MDCNNSSPITIVKKNASCSDNQLMNDFDDFKYEIQETKCNDVPFIFNKNNVSNHFGGNNPFFQTPPNKSTLFQSYMELYSKTHLMKKSL